MTLTPERRRRSSVGDAIPIRSHMECLRAQQLMQSVCKVEMILTKEVHYVNLIIHSFINHGIAPLARVRRASRHSADAPNAEDSNHQPAQRKHSPEDQISFPQAL